MVRATGLAGSGVAVGPDCVFDAVGEAVSALGGRSASVVLVFPPASLEAPAAVDQAAAAADGAPVAGMTSDGVIAASGPPREGCSALALDDSVDVGIGVAARASGDARRAGRDAAAAALGGLSGSSGHMLLLLFLDPDSGDHAEILWGVYERAGGHVPLVGGGANGRYPAQFALGASGRDSVVAVALRSPAPIGVGVADGCFPLAAPSIVTRAAGMTIQSLDGRPAENVYLEKLGRSRVELADAEFEALCVPHPLGQPALSGHVRLRHVRSRAAGGGLTCAARIPPDSVVTFMQQTPDTIRQSATQAVRDALEPLGGAPRAALVFDCAGRKRALGPRVGPEVEAVLSGFGRPAPPLAGLWTRGEVGRVRGPEGDRNHAIVVVALG
ncbi:MAG TPA: FIST N-terminal domain-containing protein [Gaiellaceae bacterium]|jgi:hypothetical protein